MPTDLNKPGSSSDDFDPDEPEASGGRHRPTYEFGERAARVVVLGAAGFAAAGIGAAVYAAVTNDGDSGPQKPTTSNSRTSDRSQSPEALANGWFPEDSTDIVKLGKTPSGMSVAVTDGKDPRVLVYQIDTVNGTAGYAPTNRDAWTFGAVKPDQTGAARSYPGSIHLEFNPSQPSLWYDVFPTGKPADHAQLALTYDNGDHVNKDQFEPALFGVAAMGDNVRGLEDSLTPSDGGNVWFSRNFLPGDDLTQSAFVDKGTPKFAKVDFGI